MFSNFRQAGDQLYGTRCLCGWLLLYGECIKNQTDADGDEVGDMCDNCAGNGAYDTDYDGYCAGDDKCPNDPTKSAPSTCDIANTDSDSDGIADCQDNCPTVCNPEQLDVGKDAIGDLCDTDPECGC